MILKLSAHHPKGVVDKVMIYVNLAEPVAGAGRYPLLVDIVVDHDAGPGRRDTLLRPLVTHDALTELLQE